MKRALTDMSGSSPVRRRWWFTAIGASAATLAVIGATQAIVALGSGPGGKVGRESTQLTLTPPALTSPTATASPTPSELEPSDSGEPRLGGKVLDAAYLKCARDAGLDPGLVQVIVVNGRPDAVKAGLEVPAAVHRPCMVAIGGADPLGSSYGYPDGLGECGGVDRDPPIDWSPPPREDSADSVVEAVKHSTNPGDIVRITWSGELNRRLAIPVDTRVECWNGQEWTLAYLALGIGGPAGQTRAVEAGQGVKASRDRAVVDTPGANILVPLIAPSGTYRVMNTAELCAVASEQDCTAVPFEVRFQVARAGGSG